MTSPYDDPPAASAPQTPRPVVAVVPAKDEETRLGATLDALATIREVGLIVVVDDGSTDATSRVAGERGVVVRRHSRNRGKAAAMATGATAAAESLGPGVAHVLLFVDADLEASAAALGALIPPVTTGGADMAIAVLPPQRQSGGGHGFVVRLARNGIQRATGWAATQPLSGMRCLSRAAYDAAQPLARGWGVEVGLTVDVLAAGLRVVEVPCELHHRVTGSDWRGQLHRARQYRDVWLALRARRR